MFDFTGKKSRILSAKLQKAIEERDEARHQRDKQKALAEGRRDRLEEMTAHLEAARAAAVPLFPPGFTVPPGNRWPEGEPPWFYADNLAVWAKYPAFLEDPAFQRAYGRGMQSGHHMARPLGSEADIHIEWRTHVVLWAAQHGAGLAGDFVECGVNTGVYSLTICDYLDLNRLDKDFWLFDTYCGIPEDQMTEQEKAEGRAEMSALYYSDCYEAVKQNFSPWPRARLVKGKIPDTLALAPVRAVSFLSVDLNIALPERAAMDHFWPLLTPGAVVVLDDYGWGRHEEQRAAMDEFARRAGVPILCLPTGQGLMIKPGAA
jgi:hypothetical protein